MVLFWPDIPLTHTTDHHPHHEPETNFDLDTIQPVANPLKISEQEILDILQWEQIHNAADDKYKQRYEAICESYKDVCDKTIRKESYSDKELYVYQILVIYFIQQIDTHRVLDTQKTLRDTMSSISIYKDPNQRRWSAGTTHVRMNTSKIDTYKEFWEVFSHEVWWHIHDLGVITVAEPSSLHPDFTEFGEPKFDPEDWSLKFYSISWIDENTRKADSEYLDFVSWYAMKDTFEELAEFANAWINHHELLIMLANNNEKIKQKYDLFQEIFGDWYFLSDRSSGSKFDANQRVFDTTNSRITQ